jgi:hypothetical protein
MSKHKRLYHGPDILGEGSELGENQPGMTVVSKEEKLSPAMQLSMQALSRW